VPSAKTFGTYANGQVGIDAGEVCERGVICEGIAPLITFALASEAYFKPDDSYLALSSLQT
jgi:hypothetical protein